MSKNEFNLEKEVKNIKNMISISLFIILAFLSLIALNMGMGEEWGLVSGSLSILVIILGITEIVKDIIQHKKDKKIESNS
jgi:hypothetical protein